MLDLCETISIRLGSQTVQKCTRLPSHREEEEDTKVDQKDGGIDGNVKEGKEGRHETESYSFRGRVPELKLWEPPYEWPKLFIVAAVPIHALPGRRQSRRSFLDILRCEIVLYARIEFGLEESEKEVQEVDAEGVGDDVVGLDKVDARDKEQRENPCERPPEVLLSAWPVRWISSERTCTKFADYCGPEGRSSAVHRLISCCPAPP